ncbi:unnamed protein product [Dibothriocephalus latus]|uniref:DZF domain-containing protein n=1 Tax=Dibothriocephalus latus TaxID=60516 RepID=A0A3P6TA25_DIBLA|nr:unnamed protein product [Dibothriocephalus latus]
MQYYRPRQPFPTAEAQEYLPPPNVSPPQRGRAPLPYRGPDMFTPGDSYPRFPSGGPMYRTPSPVHPSQQPHPSMYPSSGPVYDNAHPDSQTGYGMSDQASAQAGGFNEKPKNEAPPAPPPQLYCELCKISCFGQACFDAHMVGQKHKKRASQQEALKKLGIEPGSTPPGKLLSELRCALCDVICTGADTYQAHIIGKQHQRTLRLHKALGKPVPECELPPPKESTAPTTAEGEVPVKSEATEEASTGAAAATPEKKVGTPIAESTLKTKESESSDDCVELERPRPAQPWVRSPQLGPPPIPGLNGSAAIAWGPRLPKMNGHRPPAGVVGGLGVGYNDGFFIPPYSFVSPSYFGPGGHTSSLGDLRYMHTKLRQVMPTDAETEMIRLTVTACESALKQINDAKKFAEEEQEALNAAAAKEQKTDSEGSQEKQAEKTSATTTPTKPSLKKTTTTPSTPPPFRGVFRVGALATGLLLAGDRKADLVLVCNRWPTTDDIVEIGGELEALVKVRS